jgi:hypothetical protein
MTQQLYKARFHYKWSTPLARKQYWTDKWQEIADWLKRTKQWSNYVNHYLNVDDAARTSELVIVLNDRDTALQLKLAMA